MPLRPPSASIDSSIVTSAPDALSGKTATLRTSRALLAGMPPMRIRTLDSGACPALLRRFRRRLRGVFLLLAARSDRWSGRLVAREHVSRGGP